MDARLVKGDALEAMDMLITEEVQVDMVLCDPPYGKVDCKWDVIIPLEDMWVRLKRLIKPSGAILLFGTEPFSSKLRVSNIDQYRYDWYWEKDNASNFLFGNKQPMRTIEVVSVFYDHQPTYHSQKTVNPKGISRRHLLPHGAPTMAARELMKNMPKTYKAGKEYEADKLLAQQVIYFPREQQQGKRMHPTQKPVALGQYLIRTYTDSGETVLDFTAGSGSFGVSALREGRRFIGIERDEDYFRIMQERLGIEYAKGTLGLET